MFCDVQCFCLTHMETPNDRWILIPQDLNKTLYKGVVFVKGREFMVTFQLKSPSKITDASFRCDLDLRDLLTGYQEVLKQRLQQCTSIEEFFTEIHCLATTLLSARERRSEGKCQDLPTFLHGNIVEEIEKIGWEKLLYLNPSFKKLSLSAVDASSRQHVLNIRLNDENPNKKPSCETDLPSVFNPKWSAQDSSLLSLYEQFVQELDQYQEFWNMIDELDTNCWILEPEGQSRGCVYRRIALGNNSSILLNFDPRHPKCFPECRFLGADHVVIPLREKLNSNLHHWDQNNSVLENLELLLELKLLSPGQASSEDHGMDCSICYAYRLDNEIPEKTCDDSRCGKHFHTSCLVEWLRSLPNFRQSFNVLFGECPHCTKPLTVKMDKKRPNKAT